MQNLQTNKNEHPEFLSSIKKERRTKHSIVKCKRFDLIFITFIEFLINDLNQKQIQMKNKILIFNVIFLIILGCNGPDSVIKKDLDSRFTKFEIIEIKKDSSNIYEADRMLMGFKVDISKANLSMAIAESKYFDKAWTLKKTSHFMDSTTTVLMNNCSKFMRLMSSRSEPCYLVRYRIYKNESKIEKEEYYYMRESGGKFIETIHRPSDWSEFLMENNSEDLMGQCSERYKGFLESLLQ